MDPPRLRKERSTARYLRSTFSPSHPQRKNKTPIHSGYPPVILPSCRQHNAPCPQRNCNTTIDSHTGHHGQSKNPPRLRRYLSQRHCMLSKIRHGLTHRFRRGVPCPPPGPQQSCRIFLPRIKSSSTTCSTNTHHQRNMRRIRLNHISPNIPQVRSSISIAKIPRMVYGVNCLVVNQGDYQLCHIL